MSLAFSLCISKNKTLTPSEKLRVIFKHGGLSKLAQIYANVDLWDFSDLPILTKLKQDFPLSWAKEEIMRLKEMGAWATYIGADTYPAALAQISNPPIVLFGLGTLPHSRFYRLGFVGPRKPTNYGTRVAKWLAKELVSNEFVLVSGLAKGIDAIAHEACVANASPTIAVVAHGLDSIYPKEHEYLKDQIIQSGGAILTEFHLGTKALKHHFPIRNRIVSGLSSGVVVVEASQVSGAKITANYAVDQGREVYAVPGPIDSPSSQYTNQLVADGAKMVVSAKSILEDFSNPTKRIKPLPLAAQSLDKVELSKNELLLLKYIENSGSYSVNDLVGTSGRATPFVLDALASLELKGVIKQEQDARYSKNFA